MRTYVDLTLELVWQVFLDVEVLLNIFTNQKSARLYQLLDRQWVFGVVNFVLEHGVQILDVNICVLNKLLRGLSHENYFDAFVHLMHQQIYDF